MMTSTYAQAKCNPKVCVVLPVRNGWPYLPAAVDSVLNQTYRNFELIVIDDGSTDEGRAWLAARALQDDRLRLVANPGQGLVDALNHGMSLASGPYIARMDADDIAMPERFERQVAFLEANPSIAILGTQTAYMDENGHSIGFPSAYPTDPAQVSHTLAEKGCVLVHPSIMGRREAILQAGGYRRRTEYAEDYDLWLRLDERYALANLPQTLLCYRRHPKQISHGVNWRQRLARDVALLSARARRSGRPDPLDEIDDTLTPLSFGELAERFPTRELAGLLYAYAGARLLEKEARLEDAHQAQAIIDAARGSYFGDGRKLRCEIVARAAKSSFKALHWRVAAQALLLSLSIAPGRALSSMMGRHGQGEFRY